MKRSFVYFLTSLFALVTSCGPVPDIRALTDLDLHPPVLMDLSVDSATQISLFFTECVEPMIDTFALAPNIAVTNMECTGGRLRIFLAESTSPGQQYHLEGVVQDSNGNRLKFITNFYGFNADLPELKINEFITRGSGKHPDVVELVVISSGNLAGIALLEGSLDNWSDRFIFPSVTVDAGDFIIVHFKPQGIQEEVDELIDPGESGGYDASLEAWDFWLAGGNGISGNNGVISLYTSSYGEIIDAVLYSERTSSSDERYRGFGSRDVMERADQIYAQGGWKIDGELIAPEDAINPDNSTSTRSMCRSSESSDTDSRSDWHIVPTKGYSFGRPNSDETY